ncbi:centrosomal protein of 131 kDa-like [Pollicipes pollicipes]|uniref:centrosomal protein of 131 kDa-like n=1 Tax=Pollicipes pollicipes TaxID=41117 RepID=UPI0018858A65|nr:centrosomal protein of 131 kDa-like [Pollicipes pollicipes]
MDNSGGDRGWGVRANLNPPEVPPDPLPSVRYSDEMRRLIQQQAGTEPAVAEPVAAAAAAAAGAAGQEETAELDGSFTDLGLPDGDDTVGPSVLRLRVEFERRIATLRQQLGRKLASQTRDVRTELERKHRKEVTELERKHLTKMAQTVERYKKEAEAGRREAERQISEVRNQLIQEHQDEVQRLTQKHQEQKAESAGPADGAGDARPATTQLEEEEDGRRQMLLAELENLSFEMKKKNQSEQEAFLEQQRLSMERFARQQERAVRQLEARQQAARDEAAQAERELAALRAQSAEAEIGRDQEVARWKLELASGYETQIKAVLAGVSLDEETASSVAQLRAALQCDSGAALAELEAAHQAELRALEETLTEELESLQERLGSDLLDCSHFGEGLSLELDGLRLQIRQLDQTRQRLQSHLGPADEGATIEVAREELELLHRDR